MSVYLKAGETFAASGNIGTATSPAGVVGSGPGSYAPATADGVWTVDLPSRGSTGYSWHITVRGPAGGELTGRVWTDGAYRIQRAGNNLVDLSLWVVNTGYVYRVDLDDDDGTYNHDASAPSGEVSYERPRIRWVGPLAPGESVKITYTVTLTDGGDRQVKNVAFGAWCDANDPDCEDPPTPECPPEGRTRTPAFGSPASRRKMPELEIEKTSPDLSSARIGGTVHYRLTLTNVGPGDFTTDRPAWAIDDLTGVLDDATYNYDAAASSGILAYALPRLMWTGELVAGESVTITYSVTLTGGGDLSVTNVAFEPPCDPTKNNCDPPGDTNPPDDGGLPDTGVSVSDGVIVAGLLLALFGTCLWLLARRRGQM